MRRKKEERNKIKRKEASVDFTMVRYGEKWLCDFTTSQRNCDGTVQWEEIVWCYDIGKVCTCKIKNVKLINLNKDDNLSKSA